MRDESNGGLDAALDRLADMGLAALTREVVEPICAAMIAKARPEMSTEGGSKRFFAEYWSFARALACAFEAPQLASQAACMFFAEAPKHCAPWCESTMVEGRPRLVQSGLKALAHAASTHVDGNVGAFEEQLIMAMVARGAGSSQAALDAAMAPSAPAAPKAMAALRKDLSSGFLWPVDEKLDQAVAAFLDLRRGRGPDEAIDGQLEEALRAFDDESEHRGNHALAIAFCAKLACAAAAQPDALGMRIKQWQRIVDSMVDANDSAEEEASETRKERKRNLSKLDMTMLSSWRVMTGSARERVANEIALAAVERAGEPGGAAASSALVGFMKEMFWGAGAQLGKPNQASFTAMAQALCNRLGRDGGSACLPLEAAKELHGSMAKLPPGGPSQWCALTDPWTVDWMMRQAGEPVAHGSRWRELAALARLGAIPKEREADWASAACGWGLEPGEASAADAVSAKELAKGLGSSALGVAIRGALDRCGVPDGDGLGRLQDALAWLSDLGASDAACSRAGQAMSEALSVLERAALEGAMQAPGPDGPAPPAKSRSRL